jgi:hypothetical protein
MVDNLEECVPFLEALEGALRTMLEEGAGAELSINPEVGPEELNPVRSDLLIGQHLVRISGERKPDMYMWTETCLTAYLFVACGLCQPIQTVAVLHPFHGRMWSYERLDLVKMKKLYERLLMFWEEKQA